MSSSDDEEGAVYPEAFDDLGMLDPDTSDPDEGYLADRDFLLWKCRTALLVASDKDAVPLIKLMKELRGY